MDEYKSKKMSLKKKTLCPKHYSASIIFTIYIMCIRSIVEANRSRAVVFIWRAAKMNIGNRTKLTECLMVFFFFLFYLDFQLPLYNIRFVQDYFEYTDRDVRCARLTARGRFFKLRCLHLLPSG